MPRNEPANNLSQVVRWLAVLWSIEIIDHIVTTLVVIGNPKIDPGYAHMGTLQIVAAFPDGLLDGFGGLHPWNHQEPLLGQLLWLPLGIIGAPLLHAGWQHLIQNSLALGLLGWLSLRFSNRLTYAAIGYSALSSALLTWLIAPASTVHVGISGVIFGLVGFLLANGIIRRGWLPILIALLVFLLYGGALAGMLPMAAEERISWQMHLGGFLGGLAASWHLRREKT